MARKKYTAEEIIELFREKGDWYFQNRRFMLPWKSTTIAESRDTDENTTLDLDGEGNVVVITVGHASTRADVHTLMVSGIAT